MKKIFTVIIALMLVAVTAGCGNTAGSESSAADAQNESSADTAQSESTTKAEADLDVVTGSEELDLTIDGYDSITIDKSAIEATDTIVDTYVSSFLEAFSEVSEETTGTVEDGDTVHVVFTGRIDGEEFESGATGDEGTDIVIGSGTYLDGFEDSLIGVKVGDTVEIEVDIPEDYEEDDTEGINGKHAVFTVEVQSRSYTVEPEYNDAFVKENSEEYCGSQLDTTAEFEEFVKDYYYTNALESEIENALLERCTINSYDEDWYNVFYDYEKSFLDYSSSYYNCTNDEFAALYGYDDEESYIIGELKEHLGTAMMYKYLANEFGITYTEEELDESIQQYMDDNGYSEYYSLEAFKSGNGQAWLYMYENYNMLYEPVMAKLKELITIE